MITQKFEDFSISKEIKKAVADLGFEEATPIQAESIPLLLQNKDVVGLAKTGTGKTAAFGIPVIEKISAKSKKTQALILAPTRELAIQIAEELKKFAKYKKDIFLLPVYGGQSIDRQLMALKKGVQIVIGTPGRLLDHLDRGSIDLSSVKTVVLDEADEMLNMGFIDDIESILQTIPEDRQTVMFSATMPKMILELTKKYQSEPEYVKVIHDELTVPNIEQIYFEVKSTNKLDALTRVFDIENFKLALVFCNTKKAVDEIVTQLQARGYSADALHGDLSQMGRDKVMAKFRNGIVEILVATDVAARGLDIDNVDAVFNYDLPQDEEYYVHRIGRTGRAGKSGKAFSFVTSRDYYNLKDIERYTKSKVKLQLIPSFEDVEETKTTVFLNKVKDTIQNDNIEKYIKFVQDFADEDFTAIEVAAALLKISTAVDDNLANQDDLNSPIKSDRNSKSNSRDRRSSDRGDRGDRDRKPRSEASNLRNPARIFINLGRMDNVRAADILGMLINEVKIPKASIGSIDIFDKYSFVDIESDYTKNINEIKLKPMFKGRTYNLEIANKSDRGERSERSSRSSDRPRGDRKSFGGDRGSSRGSSRGGNDRRRDDRNR